LFSSLYADSLATLTNNFNLEAMFASSNANTSFFTLSDANVLKQKQQW